MTEPTSREPSPIPYVVPIAGFLVLTSLEGYLPTVDGRPHPLWYPVLYSVKVAVVAGLAWMYRATWRDLAPRPSARALAIAAVVGLAIIVLWVGLDGYYPPLPFLGSGKRIGFDPNVLPPVGKWAFVAVRLIGLVVLVPLIEELFWRSFLIRWLIDADFPKVPIGRVTPLAAGITSVCFALAHPEWLPALITGLAWAWLLWQTKSLSACVVSHAVANLALGIYVLMSGQWKFW
jgi:CAAX prenyl protease-like protein